MSPELDEFEVYTECAGLVLFWPYLTRIFAALSLTSERQFVDETARHQAIHLLQYLATGGQESAEHKLALHKVLCGVPIAEPVPFAVALSDEATSEADRLIRAVTKNWPAMINTSVAGFRSSFLVRNGELSYDAVQQNWLLHVEQKSYDLIMDQIPWSFRVVKLPWMPEAMYVQW